MLSMKDLFVCMQEQLQGIADAFDWSCCGIPCCLWLWAGCDFVGCVDKTTPVGSVEVNWPGILA